MNPRTSPLRTALAGLCGPSGQRDRPSADGLLAVAGLQLQAYDPPASFADPRLDALCREAARRGLVITDVQGRLVGDLRAVSVNEVLAPGTETRIGSASSAFGSGRSTFWSPGNPALSGIVIVG